MSNHLHHLLLWQEMMEVVMLSAGTEDMHSSSQITTSVPANIQYLTGWIPFLANQWCQNTEGKKCV